MRYAVALIALVLAACTPPAGAPPAAPVADVATDDHPTPFVGVYTAMSNTAMSITGDLDASPDALHFAKGFRIEGERIDSTFAGDTDFSAGGGTINGGSGIEVAEVELRRIESVRTRAGAPGPSLCGDAQPSYVILGRGGDTLTLQIFSGAEAPGPNAHDTQLCGIFNYAPFQA